MEKQVFEQWVMAETLWWSCASEKPEMILQSSAALQSLFDRALSRLGDLTGNGETPLLHLKVREIIENPLKDIRFVCAYDTNQGKLSFQHRLKFFEQDGQGVVFAECVDVTEMVQLEREIVDAQGRLSLTQLYERQALLEEQNRIIQESYCKQSRFLALLSHELRSPLLGINSMVGQLKSLYANDVYLLERLKVINLTAEQMIFLVNDILTYSQTEYESVTLHPRRFSLKQTFDYVKQLTKSIATDKGVFVSLVYRGEQDWVFGDSVRLSQILINLIVNGIKFTPMGGVSVEVRQLEQDNFSFVVTDSGEGIEEDKLKQIFDPFTQFKTEGATRTMGSGLGLSVVKHLIDLMGGEIAVTSTVGVGTTFSFSLRLPAAEENGHGKIESVTTHAVETDTLHYRHAKVLVVDDSKINRMVLSGYLRELGCDVHEAHDGQEAWNMFQQHQFEYVFLDIQMPIMDGFKVMELIQTLDHHGAAAQLKAVFAVTAGGGEELIPQGKTLASLGFSRWLVKPISKEQVLELLDSAQGCAVAVQDKADNQDEVVLPLLVDEQDDADQKTEQAGRLVEDLQHIPAHFQNLFSPFVEEFKQNLVQLEQALKAQQWHEIKALAHYMKGNCMVFQLQVWVALLREVEQITQGEPDEQVREAGIQAHVDALQSAVKHLENHQVFSHNSAKDN
ncbi:ATP-binding protein [Thiomicrorhabdus cannonii]|uniref:ATP-binding protein n=1 Tax=Thiomicrorhabdus cannonii TaxID=2748011 RepID=UPI0015BADBC8|nr:ATP-binding protein [Thiomicrorhabdus cannonii]